MEAFSIRRLDCLALEMYTDFSSKKCSVTIHRYVIASPDPWLLTECSTMKISRGLCMVEQFFCLLVILTCSFKCWFCHWESIWGYLCSLLVNCVQLKSSMLSLVHGNQNLSWALETVSNVSWGKSICLCTANLSFFGQCVGFYDLVPRLFLFRLMSTCVVTVGNICGSKSCLLLLGIVHLQHWAFTRGSDI